MICDWNDAELTAFDGSFFTQLSCMDATVRLNPTTLVLIPPLDGFRLRLSQLQVADKVTGDFVGLTRNFVTTLEMRSYGKYRFEEDFCAQPHQLWSFNKKRAGRMQLYIGFDAYPTSGQYLRPWGVSIGLGFDFYNRKGIVTECLNDYYVFYEKVCCDPELFNATFETLGSYAEGCGESQQSLTAELVSSSLSNIRQRWLFFGKRISADDVKFMATLDSLADECIRVFDLLYDAGYYNAR